MAVEKSESTVRELLNLAGIEIDGPDPWDIQVCEPRFYARVLRDSSLGLGESYMDGWWNAGSIDEVVAHILKARLDKKVKRNWKMGVAALQARLFNRQSRARAFEVGEEHYDLGNDLYTAMLDQRLTYSCAYWKNAATLDEAQEAKLDLVCRKIGLRPGMQVLDIGCGWGSFARFAAERYGVRVLGVTVSKEQVALGMQLCKGLPVELRLQDYREVQGKFDAVVSIGSLEHIGYKNYSTFMRVVDRTLKNDGIALIHTIGGNESIVTGEPWTDKYIFPNGMLPSIAQLGASMETLFSMEDWHNLGPHYDHTLMAWHANFENGWPALKQHYSERFHRMWRYYLLSSAGSFRVRNQQLWQIVITHQGTPQPDCRLS
jgi:cyclopropane-fatty-acyl-phospholipid synthase